MAGISDHVADLVEPLGGVDRRRMFGGTGLWRDGLMFAMVLDDVLYLKADDETRGTLEAEGSEPFSYATKTGRTTITSFWRAPERLYDDPDACMAYLEAAVGAARRADAKKAAKAARSKRGRSEGAG